MAIGSPPQTLQTAPAADRDFLHYVALALSLSLSLALSGGIQDGTHGSPRVAESVLFDRRNERGREGGGRGATLEKRRRHAKRRRVSTGLCGCCPVHN